MIQGEKVGFYLSGIPVPIEDCNIYMTQPTIKDIVAYGEDDFFLGVSLLGHTENITNKMREGNSQLDMFSDFQLLLVTMKEDNTVRKTVSKFLALVFPDYDIQIKDSDISFLIEQEGQKIPAGMINPFNFESFQNMINIIFLPTTEKDQEPEYNPANEAAAAIAEKLKRGREKAKQVRAKEEGPQSLFARYTSVLSIGLQMDINILFNYTPFQLYDSFNRYFAKIPCDIYTKLSTTPLMDVSKTEQPKDWVRNLY